MLTNKKLSLLGAAAVVGLIFSPMAKAATYSDTGAAVLVWARIFVDQTTDTVVQITNQSAQPRAAHCFYVNANNRCANTGEVCSRSSECEDASGFFGACQPGWIEVNFDVIMTANQPLAWGAAEGLSGSDVPCPGGFLDKCKTSDTNGGTRVPPVGESPFVGELKCIEADPITRLPPACQGTACRNDLEGAATITRVEAVGGTPVIDTEKYNAVGLRTTSVNNGDNVLTIGGPNAEYQPCADVLVFNHLFDGAIDPISGIGVAQSNLSLVPCTEDFLVQAIPHVTAQFLVYNEFEQRFSTSRPVDCLLSSQISNIDTTQSNRSIFSASVAGTVAGQTRITGVNGGLIGAATLSFCAPSSIGGGCDSAGFVSGSAGYNLNQFADRDEADFIRIP
jgi:hypothetical protein